METLSETLASSDASAAAASSRVNDPTLRDHVLAAGQRPLDRPFLLPDLEAQTQLAQLRDERAVLLVREPARNRLGPVLTDAVDLPDLLLARVQPVDTSPEVPGKVASGHPADVGDVEPEEDAGERLLLRLLNCVDGVPRRDLAVAVELEQLPLGQPVQVGHRAKQTVVPQPPDELLLTPSMSIAPMTQLFSVSKPREGQARPGQRCMTSPSGFTISASRRGSARAS